MDAFDSTLQSDRDSAPPALSPLTAQPLKQPAGREEEGRGHAHFGVRGQAARQHGGDRHEQDRPLQGRGGPVLVPNGAQQHRADGAHQEAAGEDGEGADGARAGGAGGEEELADLGREEAEVK